MKLKTLKEWLDSETKGLKKDFDKNKLIFSYNDILELKEEAIKHIQSKKPFVIFCLNHWMDFFNITEEDLKNA